MGQVAPLGVMTDNQGAMNSKGAIGDSWSHNFLKLTLRYSRVADEKKKKKVLGSLSNLFIRSHEFFNNIKRGHLQKGLGNPELDLVYLIIRKLRFSQILF